MSRLPCSHTKMAAAASHVECCLAIQQNTSPPDQRRQKASHLQASLPPLQQPCDPRITDNPPPPSTTETLALPPRDLHKNSSWHGPVEPNRRRLVGDQCSRAQV